MEKFDVVPVEIPGWIQLKMAELRENYDPYDAANLYLDIIQVMTDNQMESPSPDGRDQLKRYLSSYEFFALKSGVKPYKVEDESNIANG